MLSYTEIEPGSILGINFSGMHDSAIAIVGPSGDIHSAISLERVSRIKQDGRPPFVLLEKMPWEKISRVAVSTEEHFSWPSLSRSNLLKTELLAPRKSGLQHRQEFYDFILELPPPKEFVCHQLAHAASSFWASGLKNSVCLTYDGGMSNSPWFGGMYAADREIGIKSLDQFSALHYAKVTTLYTFVTALLGFTPNKHEGKITGLAACARSTRQSLDLMRQWFEEDYFEIEATMEWIFPYDRINPPSLIVNSSRLERFLSVASEFSAAELAAAVQDFSEKHVLAILKNARDLGWLGDSICLAGGLFSNVKINQRVAEFGFKKVFIAPPMTDDGAALGAAWHALSISPQSVIFNPKKLNSMYLGPGYNEETSKFLLERENIVFSKPENPAVEIARLLSMGEVVAIFQGHMEFGPRALGNRSILASAVKSEINATLNKRLNRTEFMPFAPVSREEDAKLCYLDIDRVLHTAEFMTVTVKCTDDMITRCPAVVHVDGTARPQLVRKEINPLVHRILTEYIDITGNLALVNTSFNIHEEPIICNPEDALKGFFEAQLDYLYLDGYLLAFKDNAKIALSFLKRKLQEPDKKSHYQLAVISHYVDRITGLERSLNEKESVIGVLNNELDLTRNQLRSFQSDHKNLIKEHEFYVKALFAYRAAYGRPPLSFILAPIARLYRRSKEIFSPRIGKLSQYKPRELNKSFIKMKLDDLYYSAKISVVTPSYQQGVYLERTINSILAQKDPNIEYFIQDGGSTDETLEVIKKFSSSCLSWESKRDRGQSHAINMGFQHTDGDIMGWLNSDDILLPGALELVRIAFVNNPEVDVVYGNRLLIDEHDREIGRWILPQHSDKVLDWVDYIPQETLFWRRQIWDKSGAKIDESFKFAMDWELINRFRASGAKFMHIPEFMGAFRVHLNQKTSSQIDIVGFEEMSRIRFEALGYLPHNRQIKRAVTIYMIQHIAVDLLYRLQSRWKNFWGIRDER